MLIQTNSELAAYCSRIQHASSLFIDTEFVGEGRYYPELGTIQIATADGIEAEDTVALIDPLAINNLTPFLSMLLDPTIEKVFHACGQDLPIFYRLLGQPVLNVFDTQIAAALLGYDDQISFGTLVERTTGVHLKKGHSFTDWLQRPLNPKQIEYALDDVRYLVPVYNHLIDELKQLSRLAWAKEEFIRLEDANRYEATDPREMYTKIRGVERMHGREILLLRELVAWREETAREQNTNPGRICMDNVLCELARRPRGSREELHEIRGMRTQQIERYGSAIIAVLKNANGTPPPALKRHRSIPSTLEPTVDFLVLCLRSLAAEASISSTLLATRSELDAVALYGENADVPIMRGWRREAFGDALLETLKGNATVRILPDTHRVHLEWHRQETQ